MWRSCIEWTRGCRSIWELGATRSAQLRAQLRTELVVNGRGGAAASAAGRAGASRFLESHLLACKKSPVPGVSIYAGCLTVCPTKFHFLKWDLGCHGRWRAQFLKLPRTGSQGQNGR